MLPALRVGGHYRARVERIHADGRVTLVIKDVAVDARAHAPLREGAQIEVEVETLLPEPVLRVIGSGRQELPGGSAEVAARTGAGGRD